MLYLGTRRWFLSPAYTQVTGRLLLSFLRIHLNHLLDSIRTPSQASSTLSFPTPVAPAITSTTSLQEIMDSYNTDRAMCRVGRLEAKVPMSTEKVARLEDAVGWLGLEKLKTQNRFISTYRRDKLQNATHTDLHFIASGNRIAHGGNSIRDCDLYDPPHGRTNHFTASTLA